MTANRWWVKLAARWLARIDGVKGQVQMFSLAVTAFSTFSLVLQNAGYGHVVPWLGIGAVIVGIVYTYLYTEGGVWNQVQRDRQDLSNNFAGPNSAIQAELNARTYAAAKLGRPLEQEEREAARVEREATFMEHRDGLEIND